ncbi:hypothetical protein CORC01_10649 [Colletotrichum orchidophilum]|uniref:YEATS domain-containing protein n=1 Tax=Colletotrichum orchidophilum TaxID=1209926 RepID=A0A1G4AY54_9PEZI|nr:uncharacterized protein CORC01_10649 [Colletotrichum orchidophilum]OHE94074.1 hypothetical protein CORC01_10649 [Colletotrichum orchidophilum]
MTNCNSVVAELAALLERYRGGGMNSSARWALSGKKESAKIRGSLEAHKGALALVVEVTTLHMAAAAATDIGKVAVDSSLIKGHTMRIIEQLAKQDEILEQIAWIRGVISQRSTGSEGGTLVMDGYLETLNDYAGSVCGDFVTDEVAEEMRRGPLNSTDRTSTTLLGLAPIKPLATLNDQPDPMTIVIGNTHRLVEPTKTKPNNRHLWSFFVRASGEEIIQQVRIDLHPTFSPSRLLLKTAPHKVTKIGWGYFVIDVKIKLKSGYRWANNTHSLHLEWKLDFDGVGSSIAHQYTVTTMRG